MFEIGFWELVLVAVVALLVFGPERMPGLVREVVSIVRHVRQLLSSARDQMNRELELDELRESLLEKKRLLDLSLREPVTPAESVEKKAREEHE